MSNKEIKEKIKKKEKKKKRKMKKSKKMGKGAILTRKKKRTGRVREERKCEKERESRVRNSSFSIRFMEIGQ